MKKNLFLILMCVVMGFALIGCGSSDKNDSKTEEAEEETQTIDEDFSIQMTDSYVFTDPQDIEFDQRYVLVGDENAKLLSDMSNMGYTASNMYLILYAKDGAAVAEYQYFVTPDEASAAELAEFYSSQGQQITQQGNVLYGYSGADQLQATITMFASTDAISDETPEAYIEMMESFNGLVEYK